MITVGWVKILEFLGGDVGEASDVERSSREAFKIIAAKRLSILKDEPPPHWGFAPWSRFKDFDSLPRLYKLAHFTHARFFEIYDSGFTTTLRGFQPSRFQCMRHVPERYHFHYVLHLLARAGYRLTQSGFTYGERAEIDEDGVYVARWWFGSRFIICGGEIHGVCLGGDWSQIWWTQHTTESTKRVFEKRKSRDVEIV